MKGCIPAVLSVLNVDVQSRGEGEVRRSIDIRHGFECGQGRAQTAASVTTHRNASRSAKMRTGADAKRYVVVRVLLPAINYAVA